MLSNRIRVTTYAILVLILIAPLANVLHVLLPLYFLGKSLWVAIQLILITMIFLGISLQSKQNAFNLYGLIVFVFVAFLIISIRNMFYHEDGNLLDNRYIYSVPIYIFVARYYARIEESKKLILKAIILQGILTALVFIVNKFYFPNAVLSTVDGVPQIIIVDGGSRSLLLGASIAANMMLVGLFAMTYYRVLNGNRTGILPYLFIVFTILFAISLGGSRYPIIVGIGILLFGSFYKTSYKERVTAFSFIVIAISVLYSNDIDLIWRIGKSNEDRFEKITVPIDLLARSPINFLLGPSILEESGTTSAQGFYFSDHSYFFVSIFFGLPFAVFYFIYCARIFVFRRTDGFQKFYIIYVLIGLSLTNCIIWESWTFVCIFCLAVFEGQAPFHQLHFNRAPRLDPNHRMPRRETQD
jgi:hypothetical protein